MDKDYGKKMAALHNRYKTCAVDFLTDNECLELRNWLREIYEYNLAMRHGINAVYFGMEHDDINRVCAARELK
jgi:hypothetical protein